MVRAEAESSIPAREPHRAELGQVDGLDLHAEYLFDRTGGDFFDAVRVGGRVAFLLSDIAGRRLEAHPIACEMQRTFRAKAMESFGATDANLMEGTETMLLAVNLALIGAAKGGICFAPTMVGCYDLGWGCWRTSTPGGRRLGFAIRMERGRCPMLRFRWG